MVTGVDTNSRQAMQIFDLPDLNTRPLSLETVCMFLIKISIVILIIYLSEKQGYCIGFALGGSGQ